MNMLISGRSRTTVVIMNNAQVAGEMLGRNHSSGACDLRVVGTKYMVVDCGGGTVDITVYEMTSDGGKLKELHMATGGPHGSTGMSRRNYSGSSNSFVDENVVNVVRLHRLWDCLPWRPSEKSPTLPTTTGPIYPNQRQAGNERSYVAACGV